ncbi:histidine phosphatase family protein [Mycobacterium sp. DL592]|uniref:histidine phosphatase family protein n=1 Tax=Mycobacterium sp. DL592 TaxID=2675524 RepID=UPI001423008C|nr:histidine phosphatase family protein [Mycobacterium sp. DL592]
MRDQTGGALMPRRALTAVMTALAAVALFVTSALPAWAADSVTVTFVRHAQSEGNVPGAGIDTQVPGPNLTTLGVQQAQGIAQSLANAGFSSVYTSTMVRTAQTAAPMLGITHQVATANAGFNEISAGIFEGDPIDSGIGRIFYFLIPLTWTLGLRSLPIPLGEGGNEFEARVNGALASVIANGGTDPVIFSHGATIMIWTMMNVNNPDIPLLLSHPLGNTEQVVITGNPQDGWTLVSYAGIPVSQTPGLATQLFVNTRSLIVAPQTAIYNVLQAVKTLDLPTIVKAIAGGVALVAKAGVDFVKNSVTDIVNAIVGALPGGAQASAAATKAATVKSAAPATEPVKDSSDTTPAASGDQSSNGATDLSDGNKVEPGKSGSARQATSLKSVSDKSGDTSSSAGTSGGSAKKSTGGSKRSSEKDAA